MQYNKEVIKREIYFMERCKGRIMELIALKIATKEDVTDMFEIDERIKQFNHLINNV